MAKKRDLRDLVSDPQPMRDILVTVEPKPVESAPREDKHAYATRLSRALAMLIADALRPQYRARDEDVSPRPDNTGHESPTGSAHGKKRSDVKVWDNTLGLKLLVSIKTYSFRDWDGKKKIAARYTKNIQRNGFEIKDEADTIHRRQPYSVMVALFFLPMAACDDGDADTTGDTKGISSFASIVRRLRVRTGRALDPNDKRFDRFDLTEKLYIGLYDFEPDAPDKHGRLGFFDVESDPPRTGRPSAQSLKSLPQLITEIKALEKKRNETGIDWEVLTEEQEAENDAQE